MKSYFEYKDDKSSKFWEIKVDENILTTRYGKIGADGQVSDKPFDNVEKAIKEYNKLIAEKTNKGYVEIVNKEVKSETEAGLEKIIKDFNKKNLKFYIDIKEMEGYENYNTLSKYNNDQEDNINKLQLLTNTKFPNELVTFYKVIGGLYNMQVDDGISINIKNCKMLISDLVTKVNYSTRTGTKLASLGLIDFIEYAWGGNRDEFKIESGFFTQNEIDFINENYKCIGWYTLNTINESAYYIYFDSAGKFSSILYDQDTFDDTKKELLRMQKKSTATDNVENIIKKAILKIEQVISSNQEDE